MTVSSQTSTATFVGNGVATAFPLPFRFFKNSDILAYFIDSTTSAATPMVLGTDYTLLGAGEPEVDGSALSILTTTVPLASMRGLYVERVMPQIQETDIVNQGEFFASTHEDVFDRLIMLIQQANSNSNGAVRVAIGDPEPERLPNAKQRAGYLMSFDSLGNPVATPSVSGSAGDLEIRLAEKFDQLKGSELVGYKGRTVHEKLADSASPLDHPYSANGDGVNSDSAAFAAFEAVVNGKLIDLGGKSYAVNSVPTGNTYINGNFIVGGFNRPSVPINSGLSVPPKFHPFGGQLRALKDRLADPLCQFVGIAFIGDSITWGSGASGTGTGLPARDGTLSDPRSTLGAPSFVNQFKRYMRSNYKSGDGLAEVVTNWPASAVGESTVLYQNIELLYPRYGQFTVAKVDSLNEPVDLVTNNSPSGMILSLNNTADSAQYGHSIAFPFTGTKFTLSVRTSAGGTLDAFIDVLVNGSPVFTAFSVQPGSNGLVDNVGNYDQQIEFTIPYVVDGTVLIRTNRNGLTGQRLLSVTALRVPKQVRITNQGIVGASSVSYREKNLDGNTSGDGVATVGTDLFVFCQLGTNDRAWTTGRPRGSNQFEVNLKLLLDNASMTGKGVVLMAANPASNEDPIVYPFHMQEVRNIIYRVAKQRSLDMIDNYSVFNGIANATYTDDGLHPNDYGHSIIARNIINSLESA